MLVSIADAVREINELTLLSRRRAFSS